MYYYSYGGEVIFRDNTTRHSYSIAQSGFIYLPAGVSIDIFNESDQSRGLIYAYPAQTE